MDVIAYNPQRGRPETITAHFIDDTTTEFDATGNSEGVSMIIDLNGDLLIIREVSREGINYNRRKAGELYKQALL